MSALSSYAPPASDPLRAVDDEPPILGTGLPIEQAEELLGTLAGVLNVRIIPGSDGEVAEVHVLTTTEVSPKQTVRNVESALLAQLGMRVSHKKISVATSEGPAADAMRAARVTPVGGVRAVIVPDEPEPAKSARRSLYFEGVEVRRSRKSGMVCCVTIRRDDDVFVGESSGQGSDRLRAETSAKAAVAAVQQSETDGRSLTFEGAKLIEAFEREFVIVALTTRSGHESALRTGSAEVKDGIETASVLAVLDATNRWVES